MTVYKGMKMSDYMRQRISEGHKGLKHSEKTKRKIAQWHIGKKRPEISKRMQGSGNHEWVGDDVSYSGLHTWIKRHLPKAELCQKCNKIPPHDVANISGKYLRDLNDWQWLCRRCHMTLDGRMEVMCKKGENRYTKWGKPSSDIKRLQRRTS